MTHQMYLLIQLTLLLFVEGAAALVQHAALVPTIGALIDASCCGATSPGRLALRCRPLLTDQADVGELAGVELRDLFRLGQLRLTPFQHPIWSKHHPDWP